MLLDDAGGERVGPRQKLDFQEVALWAAGGAADERRHGFRLPPAAPEGLDIEQDKAVATSTGQKG